MTNGTVGCCFKMQDALGMFFSRWASVIVQAPSRKPGTSMVTRGIHTGFSAVHQKVFLKASSYRVRAPHNLLVGRILRHPGGLSSQPDLKPMASSPAYWAPRTMPDKLSDRTSEYVSGKMPQKNRKMTSRM